VPGRLISPWLSPAHWLSGPCSITERDLPADDHGKRAKPGHDERHEPKIEPVCSRVLAPPAGVILEYT
jgi:hypothetical protein